MASAESPARRACHFRRFWNQSPLVNEYSDAPRTRGSGSHGRLARRRLALPAQRSLRRGAKRVALRRAGRSPEAAEEPRKLYDLRVSSSRNPWARVLGVGVIVTGILLANCYWGSFVAREHTLYTADHVAYWSLTSSLADDLKESPLWALRNVARSVAEDELNLLPSVPLAPVLLMAGDSRTTWVLAVLNVYAIPALLLGWWVLRRLDGIRGNSGAKAVAGWAWLAAVGLLAPLWQPVSLGYLGIGGLVLAFAIWGLWLRPPATSAREVVLRGLMVGALLAVLVLFRRWYAFWSLAFCVLVACEVAVGLFAKRHRGCKVMRSSLAGGLAVAGGALATLVLLGGPRLLTMVGTDYADRFAHYKVHETWVGEGAALVRQFGIIPLIAAFAGFAMLGRAQGGRRTAVVIGGQTVLAAVLFRRVQDPSPQHWYVLLPGCLILCAAGIALVLDSLEGRKRWIAAIVVALVAFWLSVGVLGIGPAVPPPFGPETRVAPVVRGDIDEVQRLLGFLDDRLAIEDRWIYLLSASGTVSDTGLGFANRSLGTHFDSPSRMLMTAKVDLRDGFPIGLFEAGLAIVPDPVQVRGATQRVVEVPTLSFRDGHDVARAFVPLRETFSIENGVNLRVWERIRPNTSEEVEALSARLREHYPDRPFVWGIPGTDDVGRISPQPQ